MSNSDGTIRTPYGHFTTKSVYERGQANPDTRLELLYLDLETTDLDVAQCGVWEVAAIGLDRHYREIFRYHSLVRATDDSFRRIQANAKVVDMHAQSGLYGEIVEHRDTLPILNVIDCELAELVEAHSGGNKVTLGGGGTERFDRLVIRQQMPLLDAQLNYWCEDYSGMRRTFQRINGRDILPDGAVQKAHRALADIEEDVRVARAFAEILNVPEHTPNNPVENVLEAIALLEAYDAHQVGDPNNNKAGDIEALLSGRDLRHTIVGLLDVSAALIPGDLSEQVGTLRERVLGREI